MVVVSDRLVLLERLTGNRNLFLMTVFPDVIELLRLIQVLTDKVGEIRHRGREADGSNSQRGSAFEL